LHAGHASLLRAARQECGFVVASIFVNPAQFGPNEDFRRYPRNLVADLQLCRAESTDLVFTPSEDLMYPPGFRTFVEVRELQDLLCGAQRPGHFRGVATVVAKLFHMVQPDVAFFGQKDAQQALIIRQMVRDLDLPVEIRVCPIVREADGVALSSRNRYLNPDQRRRATVLYQALESARQLVERGEGDGSRIRQLMVTQIEETPGAVLDYAAVVNAHNLHPLKRLEGDVLLALAVKFGDTRLIDNVCLTLPVGS
jgi:pantoate--beta-alanine ligase